MIDIRPAAPEDNEKLLELLNRCPRGTGLVVRQERYGDFFARSRYYDAARTYAAWDQDRIVGVLECALNPMMLQGNDVLGGYLYGLSVDPEYRRLGIANRLLSVCESYLQEHGADFAYCTVLDDNFPSLGLLGRSGYTEHTRLQQQILVSLRRQTADPRVRKMIREDISAVAALLNRTYDQYEMYKPFTADTLADHLDRLPGFKMEEDLFVLEEQGQITACLGCWQISRVVSSVILQWDRRLAATTRLGQVLQKWLPVPHAPKLGETYRFCAAYPLAFQESATDLAPLWSTVHHHVTSHELGSLTVSVSSTGQEHTLKEAGMAVRGSSSRFLVKPFSAVTIEKNKPVFVLPLE